MADKAACASAAMSDDDIKRQLAGSADSLIVIVFCFSVYIDVTHQSINCFIVPNRPHYASCLSVCSVPASNMKTRKHTESKIGVNFLLHRSYGRPNFQFRRSKIESPGHQKP